MTYALKARQRLLRLGVTFTGLNLGWEILQLPLYTVFWSDPWSRAAFAVAHCTAGDLLIGAAIFALVSLPLGPEVRANPERHQPAILAATTLGVAYTIWSEWMNVEVFRTWEYTDWMPRLPPLGTGLTPVLQWAVIPALTVAVSSWWSKRGPH